MFKCSIRTGKIIFYWTLLSPWKEFDEYSELKSVKYWCMQNMSEKMLQKNVENRLLQDRTLEMRSSAPCLYAMNASLAEPRLNKGATADPGKKE